MVHTQPIFLLSTGSLRSHTALDNDSVKAHPLIGTQHLRQHLTRGRFLGIEYSQVNRAAFQLLLSKKWEVCHHRQDVRNTQDSPLLAGSDGTWEAVTGRSL